MPEQFIHGVEVVEVEGGARPIRTVKSSVIGLVGTASKGPLNTPTLILGSRKEAVEIFGEPDALSTIPDALDAIFDQSGALVVVVRVENSESIIGGVDAGTGQYQGVQALLAAEAQAHVTPRILIAPGYTQDQAVLAELVGVAERLRAVVIADGPDTTDIEAITYRENFGSDRVYIVDPWVKVWKDEAEVTEPASARVAGLIAKSDNENGFWHSPSNLEISGIIGTGRSVDYTLGDPNCRANYLNENEVATIIHLNGYRLWGNRTTSADPKYAFLSVRRTADIILDSILRAHLWAVDRNITKTYLEDVAEGVNAYLRHLKAIGAILGGKCWADPELNTPEQIADGKVYFDFDFTPPYPAEHITFRAHLVNDYIEEIVK